MGCNGAVIFSEACSPSLPLALWLFPCWFQPVTIVSYLWCLTGHQLPSPIRGVLTLTSALGSVPDCLCPTARLSSVFSWTSQLWPVLFLTCSCILCLNQPSCLRPGNWTCFCDSTLPDPPSSLSDLPPGTDHVSSLSWLFNPPPDLRPCSTSEENCECFFSPEKQLVVQLAPGPHLANSSCLLPALTLPVALMNTVVYQTTILSCLCSTQIHIIKLDMCVYLLKVP